MKTIIAVALTTLAAPAFAQEPSPPSGWSGALGLGAAVAPTYDGSPNYQANPLPILSLSYRSVLGVVELGTAGMSWTFLDIANLQVGVLASSSTARKDSERREGPFTFGDDRLEGMGNLRSTAEGGAMVAYGPIKLIARQAIGDRGHRGLVADLSFSWGRAITPELSVGIGASTRYGDRDYTQAYFGVTEQQAAASRFDAYAPRAGIISNELSFSAQYAITRHWSVQSAVSLRELTRDAKDSPLAEEPRSATGYVGIAWQFD